MPIVFSQLRPSFKQHLMKFKQVLTAAALAIGGIASSHANTAETAFSLNSVGGANTQNSFSAYLGSAASFDIFYSFTADATKSYTVDVSSYYNVANFEVLVDAQPLAFSYSGSPSNGSFYTGTLNLLAGSTHIIQVSGTYTPYVPNVPGATFFGTVTAVAAVPEPETFVMLLAGLGLITFVARRRHRALAT